MKSLTLALLTMGIVMLAACSNTMGGAQPTVTVQSDPAWDAHRDYLDALVHRVRDEWYRNITMDSVRAPAGTTVNIRIRYFADGGEPAPISMEGGTRKTQRACAKALMKQREPWPAELSRDLGEYQSLDFTFVYP